MKPKDFIALNARRGDKLALTLIDPYGRERKVTLFFRGYETESRKKISTTVSGIRPVFSPPNEKGHMSRNRYKACDTSFSNIIDAAIENTQAND